MNPKFSSHRSISLDVFDLKRRKERYTLHLNKLEQIQQIRFSHKKQAKKIKEVTKQMHKTRELARQFRKKQEQLRRKKQDSKMLGNIIDRKGRNQISSGKNNKEVFLHSTIHKRMAEKVKIESQNRKLVLHLLNQQANIKQFKKKIHTQAKQYYELKRHMNRFKTVKVLTERAQKQWSSQKTQFLPNVSSGRTFSTRRMKAHISRDRITQQVTNQCVANEV